MKDFKKLVSIITDRGLKNIPLLYFNKDVESTGKELELFMKTQAGEFDTDKDASLGIYGEAVPDHRYKMLKSRVKQKLLNHLYFLDFDDEKVNNSNKYEEECLRLMYFSKILINEGEKTIAEKLLNKCLYLSKEAEFTYLIIDCLELLRWVHSENCRPIHFKKVKDEIAIYQTLYRQEEEARDIFYFYKILLTKSGHSRKKSLDEANEAIAKLKNLSDKNNSYQIIENYYQLSLLYMKLTGDYEAMIQITENFDQLYNENKINIKRFDPLANKANKIYAHLKARDYRTGITYAELYLNDFYRSSHLWFKFMENYFILAMHNRSYDLASNIINKVFINSYYDNISKEDKETWKLFRSYLYFVDPNEILLRNFNFVDFITKLPNFQKHKIGFNTALLILQYLNYLKNDEVGMLKVPLEELNKYIQVYCPDCFSKRTKTFIKLLNTVVNTGMEIKEIKLKTKYLATKLHDINVSADDNPELEIIPYEQLWDKIIKYLKINEVKAEF